MSIATKQFGDEGEEIAVELLQEKGYEIIERNYQIWQRRNRYYCKRS